MKVLYVAIGVAAVVALAVYLGRGRNAAQLASEPPPAACPPEALWAALESSGVWFALEEPPDQDGNVLYVEPKRGDSWIFPIFSSSELAEHYLASIASTYERRSPQAGVPPGVAAFPLLQGKPEFIARNTWQPDQLVLNPGTSFERVFSPADHSYFRSRAGG